MILRIVTNEKTTDITLNNMQSFSLGTGENDDYVLASDRIHEHHMKLVKEDTDWIVECCGEVFLQGEIVKRERAIYNAAYVLDFEAQIAVICIDETKLQQFLYPLNEKREILIGRGVKNDIVMSSTLISKRHAVLKKVEGTYCLIDNESTNGTYVNGTKVKKVELSSSDKICIGESTIVFHGEFLEIYGQTKSVSCETRKEQRADISGNIAFQRAPRLKKEVPTEPTEISAPPRAESKPEINLLTTFLPAMGTIGIAIAMTVIMSSSMMLIYTLPMTLIGLITSVTSYFKQNKKFKNNTQLRKEKYLEYLRQQEQEIQKKQSEQRQALLEADPDTTTCFDIADAMDHRLWERRPLDTDFMSVRVGSGTKENSFKIIMPKESFSLENDELRQEALNLYNRYAQVDGLPITCDIMRHQVCGIVGNHADAVIALNTMMAQIATHHCYTEVQMAVLYDESDETAFSWTRQLPHAQSSDKRISYIATNKQDADRLFASFTEQLKRRKMLLDEDDSYGKKTVVLPFYLFVISQPGFLEKKHIINEYIFRNKDLSTGVIMLVDDIDQLPKECNLIIEVKNNSGIIYHKDNVVQKQEFLFDDFEIRDCTRLAGRLNRLICDEAINKSTIPSRYSFFEMLGVKSAEELDISARWGKSDVTKSMEVPVGIGDGNKLISLDIHENSHGPHGLLAGMTGSGKSEVLQSFVLSLALQYRPDEVGFVIIDFKGGGMAHQFTKLPHLRGTITNIEGNSVIRSLAAIKAELVKRQKVFADNHVNNIDSYIEKYKNGQARVAIPHLVIIVDEFAELKAEQPEFMKELISAARIGRSLGIHLILATQKPAGQVSEQIWSNSRFRVCLKVATREDSSEMIKSPLAFSIMEKGRAYLQVGNNEVFEMFQSGYSGEKLPSGKTQFEAIVDQIQQYCIENNIQALPSICLPELPGLIQYQQTEEKCIPIGILDDPNEQRQERYILNCFDRNTIIFGSAQSGKTWILQNILRGIGSNYTPDEIHAYVIDCASGSLRLFEHLPQVGGVVTSLEDEKLKNLMKLLFGEIETRKEKFMQAGVGSFSAYQEISSMPHIVLLIDNLSALRELYFQDDDAILDLCQNGLSYGISVIATCQQTSGMGYKYISTFANRIALRCNESTEYSAIFGRCALTIPDIQGRCIVENDKKLYLCQMFCAFEGEKESDRVQAIKTFIEDRQLTNGAAVAPRIPMIPDKLGEEDIFREYADGIEKPYQVVLGLDYGCVAPINIDFAALGMLAVLGSKDEAKYGWLHYCVNALNRQYPGRIELYAVDGIGRHLSFAKELPNTRYTLLADEAVGYLKDVEQKLQERYASLAAGNDEVLDRSALLMVIIDSEDAIAAICNDTASLNAYRNMIGRYKNLNVCLVISGIDNSNIPYSAPEILKNIRDNHHMVFFDNITSMKIFDIPLAVERAFKKPVKHGDAYYIKDSSYVKLKTPQADS